MNHGIESERAAWLLTGILGLGACAHATAVQPESAAHPEVAAQQAVKTSPPAPAETGSAATDLQRMIDGAVLHFGFDEANLTSESRERLTTIAGVMRARPDLAIRVAGNCDERGTEEYNLALGERRASAAKKYLVNLGIDANRIGTISYGKERPAVTGHDERAWAENRRDEFQPTRGL